MNISFTEYKCNYDNFPCYPLSLITVTHKQSGDQGRRAAGLGQEGAWQGRPVAYRKVSGARLIHLRNSTSA